MVQRILRSETQTRLVPDDLRPAATLTPSLDDRKTPPRPLEIGPAKPVRRRLTGLPLSRNSGLEPPPKAF